MGVPKAQSGKAKLYAIAASHCVAILPSPVR